jgi:putative hemolysin
MSEIFWQSPWPWLVATLLCIMLEGFFSMQEMAIVSLNRLDLLYDCARGSRRARWISKLLQNPHQLFSTTLLVVNLVLQIGSECSRRFYIAMDLSSGIAPVSQVILVIICAELAPMFAARQYPHQVAFAGIPILYAVSLALRPIVLVVASISNGINRIMGTSNQGFSIVSREDLKSIVKRLPPAGVHEHESFLETVGSNILSLQKVCAGDIATPLHTLSSINSRASLDRLRSLFKKERPDFVLVYDHLPNKISGIALPRSLIDPSSHTLNYIYQITKPVLTIHASDSLLKVLAPLRQSRYSIALVLDASGQALGCLTFDEVAQYLFGAENGYVINNSGRLLERYFEFNLKLGQLRKQWGIQFDYPDEWTLERFLTHALEKTPDAGDKYYERGVAFEVGISKQAEPIVLIRAFVQNLVSSKDHAEISPLE